MSLSPYFPSNTTAFANGIDDILPGYGDFVVGAQNVVTFCWHGAISETT